MQRLTGPGVIERSNHVLDASLDCDFCACAVLDCVATRGKYQLCCSQSAAVVAFKKFLDARRPLVAVAPLVDARIDSQSVSGSRIV